MEANTTESLSSLGNPIEIARHAGQEFNGRSYFQRHPRAKRVIMASLVVGLLVVASLMRASGSASAGQYCVTAEIDGKDGKILSSPNILMQPDGVATIAVQGPEFEYQLEVKSGDLSKQAQHSVELRWVTKDANGKKSTMRAPRIQMLTGQTAEMKLDDIDFHVCVAPRAITR
jgi:hypothetical protein